MTDASNAAQWAQAVIDRRERVQPGTLDLRVLDQDRIWIDESGRVHLLAEMDEPYLTNVLTFLLVRGRTLQRRLAVARVCELLDAVDENLDPIEIGHIAVLAIDALEEEDPATWLKARPLAAAIISRVAGLRRGLPT
jgi:hypothetical protein